MAQPPLLVVTVTSFNQYTLLIHSEEPGTSRVVSHMLVGSWRSPETLRTSCIIAYVPFVVVNKQTGNKHVRNTNTQGSLAVFPN